MKIIRVLFMFSALPMIGWGQLLTFGFQGGAPAQTPLSEATAKMPFALGPTVDVRVFSRLSVESGMLYYRLGDRNDDFAFAYPDNALTLGLDRWRGKAFEIPFLLKYKFLSERRIWQPFITAGPALRRTSLEFTRFSSVFRRNQQHAINPAGERSRN